MCRGSQNLSKIFQRLMKSPRANQFAGIFMNNFFLFFFYGRNSKGNSIKSITHQPINLAQARACAFSVTFKIYFKPVNLSHSGLRASYLKF